MIDDIKINSKRYFDTSRLVLFLLLPFFSSCSTQEQPVEIITPPIFPKEFSSIPDQTKNPQLINLLSADERIKNISVGRKDPFLQPQSNQDQLSIPNSFKYHGQISSSDLVNAFVSYEDRKGTIKPGDIGGKSTDLLPNGWTLFSLDTDTKVLTLVFESQSVNVDLFPKNE